MLKSGLLHPGILKALASNGHGARVLIADGNFPVTTCTPQSCEKVFLNFAPGLLKVTDVLNVINNHIVIESAMVMTPVDDSEQEIFTEFDKILGKAVVLKRERRFEFYKEAGSPDTCLVIATGETRRFANILLVIGSIVTVTNDNGLSNIE